MRRLIALIFALIGTMFIRIAVWFDREIIRDVLLNVVRVLDPERKPPARKPDPSGLYPRDVERYTIEDFEEPH